MRVFLTGGNGFIGMALIRQLLARGDEVVALTRTLKGASILMDLGVRPVAGDILQPASYRRLMAGAEVVFHLAAWRRLGVYDRARMRRINVDGTRAVLESALALPKVPRVVYTSTAGLPGHDGARAGSEGYWPPADGFLSEYHRTMALAHHEVALPLQRAGAPLVIVQPGMVYGPEDTGQFGAVLKRYVRGRLPVMIGPKGALAWAHVDDVAAGHLLAAGRGRAGESYPLAGEKATLREFFCACERAGGPRAPRLWLPGGLATAAARLLQGVDRYLPRRWRGAYELARCAGGCSCQATPDAARRELGWQPRSLAEGLPETLAWWRSVKDRPPPLLFSVNENDGRVFGP